MNNPEVKGVGGGEAGGLLVALCLFPLPFTRAGAVAPDLKPCTRLLPSIFFTFFSRSLGLLLAFTNR